MACISRIDYMRDYQMIQILKARDRGGKKKGMFVFTEVQTYGRLHVTPLPSMHLYVFV